MIEYCFCSPRQSLKVASSRPKPFIPRIVTGVSPKPSVISTPVFAPRRSSRPLVATVVPCEKRRMRRMNSARSRPASAAARSKVASTPSTRLPGVVEDLYRLI